MILCLSRPEEFCFTECKHRDGSGVSQIVKKSNLLKQKNRPHVFYYCYTNKKWFPRLETIFVVDHMVIPIRFSLLRKEAKQLLFTVSVDAKNS